jgi:hypothetical protein
MSFLPSTSVIHESADAMLDGYQPSLFKRANCLTGNSSADVVFLHEIHLAREHLSRLELPANDSSHELLEDVSV